MRHDRKIGVGVAGLVISRAWFVGLYGKTTHKLEQFGRGECHKVQMSFVLKLVLPCGTSLGYSVCRIILCRWPMGIAASNYPKPNFVQGFSRTQTAVLLIFRERIFYDKKEYFF